MDLFTVDFETFYSKTYSLTKLTYEEYLSDPQFQIMMVGVKKNDEETEVFIGYSLQEYREWLITKGVDRGAVLCHNTMFDGIILQDKLGIMPPMLLDTLCMAQAILKPRFRSISLANCLKNTNSPLAKGGYLANMIDRRLESLTSSELQKYSVYCADDCEGEYWLFQHLAKLMPREELEIIDMTLRMYLEPQFQLDPSILRGILVEAREESKRIMLAVEKTVTKSQLSSNPQFAEVLTKLGVEVPMKISPTTDKPTYAFAKTDEGWKDLEDEYADDPLISAILTARLGAKSTIAVTRAQRFLDIADNYGHLRVPLRYYGAHTGRYGGMHGINCQNLTRINPDNPSRNQLRYAVRAPKGHVILAADLSQIEARLNSWLAECHPLLQVFRDKGDPYCAFASKVFGRVITKADPAERFIGKTCILGLGYGMGAAKLKATLRKDGHKVSDGEAKRYVDVYRNEYSQIPALWRFCDGAIKIMAGGGIQVIGPCAATQDKITLPNGMPLSYHRLREVSTKKYTGWGFDFAGRTKTLWGGKVVENIVQSLARISITEHMRQAKNELGIHPALQAHDELVYVVPESRVDHYMEGVLQIMRTPPEFAPDLPVDAEAGWGETYGDAK